MNAPLPSTLNLAPAVVAANGGASPFSWINGLRHFLGNPHAPDPEKTSWQLPGRGVLSGFIRLP